MTPSTLSNAAARRAAGLLLALAAAACVTRSAPPAPPAPTNGVPGQLDTTQGWVQVLTRWSDESAHDWTNDSLRNVLVEMARADQAARAGLTAARASDTAFMRNMARVDSVNAAHLREILARFGWPTRSMVGAKGASAAWLVVQHSAALQEEGERLMLAAPPGEVSPSDLALLIDRRLVSQQRPQRYGSQLTPFVNGTTSFYPVEDPAGLAERRAAAGLPPLADYVRMIEEMYQVKVIGTIP